MSTEVKNHFKFVFLCAKYNLTREMDNRAAFVLRVLGMFANNSVMILQWVILFSFTETIGGYGFGDVLTLWGLAASTFGLAHVLFLNTSFIPAYVTEGKLDAYLVQPKNALLNVACGRMSVSAVGDLAFGFALAAFVRPSPVPLLMFLFFTVSGGFILAAFYTISGCAAFWLRNSDQLSSELNGVAVSFSTYPEGLFDGRVKWLLYTIVPVGFSAYVPMRFFITFDYKWALIALGFTVFIVSAAFLVFRKGLRKYSSGNLMGARL